MDFSDQIRALGERIARMKESIATEEATKTAFVMPFLAALGYDVFNPFEVVPEFIADLGLKKGEKVDYCIQKDNQPIIIIECKHWSEKLDPHTTQLFRYFHVTSTRFALLTNGIRYRFYSDLLEPNKMDEKPFWEFDITDLNDAVIAELKKFHKSAFNVEQILSTASELKYTKGVKELLAAELKEPSVDFVRLFAKQVYPGMLNAKAMEQFTGIVRKSSHQLINEMISDRLKSALAKENELVEIQTVVSAAPIETPSEATGPRTEFTDEERESYLIVKSILRPKVDAQRIVYRDTQSYLNVLLDDNIRKTVCRLWLNGSKKYIGFLDADKKETRYELATLDTIYDHADKLFSTLEVLDNKLAKAGV
ncbi:type I restriction endonuclease [Solirubrum puertoriconensis]|uniref:Restriction endonuclease n=1 Tax=Solirubrum puertoriconensis TaxID=1751427 RepID=A0A9X0L3C4_SOLP1|nr:type I restriction endonuclease [Solirubrum puertoriconensis]KUG06368.1 restriction endonuclease [Solirubrum puertoriconensis]